MYLIHPTVQFIIIIGTARIALSLSGFNYVSITKRVSYNYYFETINILNQCLVIYFQIHNLFGDLVTISAVALCWTLAFESPIVTIEKLLFQRFSKYLA